MRLRLTVVDKGAETRSVNDSEAETDAVLLNVCMASLAWTR